MDIFADERTLYVKKDLPVDFVEFQEVIIVSLAYLKRMLYGGAA